MIAGRPAWQGARANRPQLSMSSVVQCNSKCKSVQSASNKLNRRTFRALPLGARLPLAKLNFRTLRALPLGARPSLAKLNLLTLRPLPLWARLPHSVA
jgi:hypothetical protein